MTARRATLTRIFELLYGPLVLLHEPAGRLAFGQSWPGRRLALLDEVNPADRILDVGAGSGILVAAGAAIGLTITGIDPSPGMRRQAARRGATVLPGRAQSLPIPDESVTMLVSSYPGPWIADPETWEEFQRVLAPGGRIAILFGGTVERGPGSPARSRLLRLLYEREDLEPVAEVEIPTPDGMTGSFDLVEDEWGHALIWHGIATNRT